MDESHNEKFEAYFERYDSMWSWFEHAVLRYLEAKDVWTLPEEELHKILKEFSPIARRIQEGRESYFSEIHRVRKMALEDGDDDSARQQEEADRALREACRADVGRFAHEFFPDHCRLTPSPLHRWMFREYDRRAGLIPPVREGRNLAVAAPRGHAKSTLQSLILPLHSILYGRERYIVLLSATLKQSRQRLRAIGEQLRTNKALRRVFGEGEGAKFSGDVVEAFGTRVDAYSAGSEFRGVTFGEFRPTHIILDDAEDSESVESPEQREKLEEWFSEVVENLGNGYTNITVVGTLLHPQSLLAMLLKRPDFKTGRFQAVRAFSRHEELWGQWRELYTDLRDPARATTAATFYNRNRREMMDGARALWPEKESYYKLMIQQATRGRRAFFQEKQNDPRLAEAALFDPDRSKRFHLERDGLVMEGSEERVGLDELRVFGFLDAAMGKGGARKGDYAALVTVGADSHGFIYVLDARVERARPSEQARWVFDLFERWGHTAIGVEGNCFQELMMMPIEEERKRRRTEGKPWQVAVDSVHHRTSKDGRIRSMEALIENGFLRFARGLSETFIQQLEGYPGPHDDGPDALAAAVAMARAPIGRAGETKRRKRETGGTLERF